MGSPKGLGGIPLPGNAEVGCIACGQSLHLLPDSYPLVFHCQAGHFMTVQDLLEELLPMGRAPQPSAVEYWSRTSLFIEELAARALECGHVRLASDLEEAADRLCYWTESLKTLLNLPSSG